MLVYLHGFQPSSFWKRTHSAEDMPRSSLKWTQEPPSKGMIAQTAYEARVNVSLDANETGLFFRDSKVIKNDGVDFPHVNLHSCSSKVSFCTPLVANDGTLATHSPERKGRCRRYGTFELKSEVLLPEGSYTIIAHARFFTSEYKVDVAKALKRQVVSEESGQSKGYHLGDYHIPICWKTYLDPNHHRYNQVVQLNECPSNIKLDWTQEPPEKGMVAGATYKAKAMVTLGTQQNPLMVGLSSDLRKVTQNPNHIAHFNFHSCFSSVAFCTYDCQRWNAEHAHCGRRWELG